MAKVLLIQPHNDRRTGEPLKEPPVPLSPVYLATAIGDFHEVKIYDRNLLLNDEHLLDFIKKYNPDIVGMSSITSSMLFDLIHVGKLVKENFPKKLIVIGGIHATAEPESILKEQYVDYIIRGEGDEAFLDFCNTYDKNPKKLKDLKNVNRNPLRPFCNLKDLKLPNYSLVDLSKYKRVDITLSRGCMHNCSFCYTCEMWGINGKSFVRMYDTTQAKEFFKELIEKNNIKIFHIVDDNFVIAKSRVIEICDFLSKYDVHFFCFARADSLDDEIMAALKKGGCHTIFIGAESGSQRLLDFLNKEIKLEDTIKAIKLCRKYKITSDVAFMIGTTTETIDDLNMTADFIKKYKPDVSNVNIFNPFPATKTFEYCIKNKLIKKPQNLIGWADWTGDMRGVKHNTSEVSDEVVLEYREKLLLIGLYKLKIKRFFYWAKLGEFKYILRRIEELFFKNGKLEIPGLKFLFDR